ncbi:MAG: hypothetical protein IJ138_05580 [Clostridia bacterium]|nr:hypothetical protein [Clostridia bacterium]
MKKWLLILLAALLLFALLPSAAFADPPQSDPTHQHNWVVQDDTATCTASGKRVWVCTVCGQTYGEASPAKGHKWDSGKVTRAATCEKDGVKTYTCSRCKNTRTEAIRALGHDWDEGKVTAVPHGFTPGERTYTCKRDASHTRTEAVEGLAVVFEWLHGVDFSSIVTYSAPLTIIEQPQGGTITRGKNEGVTMHVTATGGAGGYTYEWRSHGQDVGQDEKYNDLLKWFVGLFGMTPEQVDAALETPLSTEDMLTVYNAGDSYYCIVTDAANKSVTSEMAEVRYKVRITKQPQNANLQPAGSATLTCEAADGMGKYTYRWIDNQDNEIGFGSSIPVNEIGDYMCIVTDDATGDEVHSDACVVYSTKPLAVYSQTPNQEVWDGDKLTVKASFWYGVEPYKVWWTYNGDVLDTYEGTEYNGHLEYCADTYKAGVYTVHAEDALGATAEANIYRSEKHLEVLRQPVGGELPLHQYVEISAEFGEGEAPYTYYLYCNGKAQQVSHVAPSFKVWYPCTCSILAVDNKNRSVMTKTVTVSEATFRIKEQTESESIHVPYGKTRIHVTPENGITPYTYEWSFGDWSYKEGRYIWHKLNGTESYYDADRIGRYRCLVRDAEKNFVWSKEIPVEYVGSAPMIVKQPTSRIVVRDEDGYFDTTFYCEAVSANPDDQLSYQWYWRAWEGGIWQPVYTTISKYYDAYRPGMYQCKVVNLENDEYTWSEYVTAIDKLECVSARPARHSGDADWVFQFSFTGGAGPYEVYICHTFGDDAMPYAANMVRQTEVLFEDRMKLLTFTLPKYAEFWHYDTQSYDVEAAQYYLFVRDALGQECKTPLVTWY